jgi:hypothetical protein
MMGAFEGRCAALYGPSALQAGRRGAAKAPPKASGPGDSLPGHQLRPGGGGAEATVQQHVQQQQPQQQQQSQQQQHHQRSQLIPARGARRALPSGEQQQARPDRLGLEPPPAAATSGG